MMLQAKCDTKIYQTVQLFIVKKKIKINYIFLKKIKLFTGGKPSNSIKPL